MVERICIFLSSIDFGSVWRLQLERALDPQGDEASLYDLASDEKRDPGGERARSRSRTGRETAKGPSSGTASRLGRTAATPGGIVLPRWGDAAKRQAAQSARHSPSWYAA